MQARLGICSAFSPGIFLNKQGEQVYYDNGYAKKSSPLSTTSFASLGGRRQTTQPTIGYQFANDECLKSGLALGLVETDLAWGTMLGHGFVPDPDATVLVGGLKGGRASGYEVSILDGKPAAARLRELRRASPSKTGQMLLGQPDGRDHHIVCALNEELLRSGCLRLNRKIQRGEHLCLLKADGPAVAKKRKPSSKVQCTTQEPLQSV